MATTQYIRKVSLLAGNDKTALEMSELQFRFVIRRGDLQTPNSADIRVYNVSDATASKFIHNEFNRIVINAGYENNYGVIFDGTIKQVRHGRESQVDTYLDITAADGDQFYNYSTVNVSLAAGSKQLDHVKAIVNSPTNAGNAQNVSLGYTAGLDSTTSFPRGKVMYGMARDYLRKTAATQDANWHIQNGELTIVARNNFVPEGVIEINSANGMVGLPEQTQNGIRVRCLLNPSVRINSVIKINNASIQLYRFGLGLADAAPNGLLNAQIHLNHDGLYKVLWVDYIGNTRDTEWYSDITCISVDAQLGQNALNKAKALPSNATPPINVYGD